MSNVKCLYSLNSLNSLNFRMSAASANLSLDLDFDLDLVLDDEGNFTFVVDFEVFTFRDAINVAAYTVMSAGVIVCS